MKGKLGMMKRSKKESEYKKEGIKEAEPIGEMPLPFQGREGKRMARWCVQDAEEEEKKKEGGIKGQKRSSGFCGSPEALSSVSQSQLGRGWANGWGLQAQAGGWVVVVGEGA